MTNKEEISVKKGDKFTICTQSYSDTRQLHVTALKDITRADFEKMHEEIQALENLPDSEGRGLYHPPTYEAIAPYLCLKGFITDPEQANELHFHYETDPAQAYWDSGEYELNDYNETLEKMRPIWGGKE